MPNPACQDTMNQIKSTESTIVQQDQVGIALESERASSEFNDMVAEEILSAQDASMNCESDINMPHLVDEDSEMAKV